MTLNGWNMRYEIVHNGDHWMLMKVETDLLMLLPKYTTIFRGRYFECEKLKRELEEQQKLKES